MAEVNYEDEDFDIDYLDIEEYPTVLYYRSNDKLPINFDFERTSGHPETHFHCDREDYQIYSRKYDPAP